MLLHYERTYVAVKVLFFQGYNEYASLHHTLFPAFRCTTSIINEMEENPTNIKNIN